MRRNIWKKFLSNIFHFVRFFFLIISIIFVIQLVVISSGKGAMQYFLSVPYQTSDNNDGFYFSIKKPTEYEFHVDVLGYGEKSIKIDIFRVKDNTNIRWLHKELTTYGASKNSVIYKVNLKAGAYYFKLKNYEIKDVMLYQSKPTSYITELLYSVDRDIIFWVFSPFTGGISFIYLLYFFAYYYSRSPVL